VTAVLLDRASLVHQWHGESRTACGLPVRGVPVATSRLAAHVYKIAECDRCFPSRWRLAAREPAGMCRRRVGGCRRRKACTAAGRCLAAR
jgi:hypothetical protein